MIEEQLKGKITKIIFYNPDNLYTVALMETEDGELCIVGNISELEVGHNVECSGKFKTHQKYGFQFEISKIDVQMPKKKDDILAYLSSGMIAGIGPKKAKDIVDEFGSESLDILQYYPEKLSKVKGIGKKIAVLASYSYNQQLSTRDIIMELSKYNIKPHYANKLYREYKEKTLHVIKTNPYILIDDIHGIGFIKADEIALKMGLDHIDPYRVSSGIRYIMSECYKTGNTYMEKEELIKKAKELLFVEEDVINYNLSNMFLDESIILEVIGKESRCFLPGLHEAEIDCGQMIYENLVCETNHILPKEEIEKNLKVFESENNISLNEEQKQGIINSLSSKISVITGGPGTGKTTIINAIIYIIGATGKRFSLAAPTGRAAKRMSESCNEEASTVHRLLEYSFNENGRTLFFGKNEDNQIDSDYIILDEMSMMDIMIFKGFLKAVKPTTSLIFVGDVNQLPSVGAGNVLSDLMKCEYIYVSKLEKIYRQSETSMIIYNAHEVNKGRLPILDKECNDFFFVNAMTQEKILQKIKKILLEYEINPLKNYSYSDIQIISPVKRGLSGVINLNKEIQKIQNEDNLEEVISFGEYSYGKNDKVMHIKNNYNLSFTNILTGEKGKGVFNGDMGVVESIDKQSSKVNVLYDNERLVTYEYDMLSELNLSYAITVHKSQGCEFKVVIIPVFSGSRDFLTRNLIYTAITRAKEMVIIVGQKAVLEMMVKNNKENKRKTSLHERILANIN